jgi:hypothetical protein
MPWWGWIVVGAALLGSEVLVDAQFYLVFLGLASLAVGGIALAGVSLPVWGQWLAFGTLSAFFYVAFRERVYTKLRGAAPEGLPENLVGETAVALEPIAPGGSGRAELRGSPWSARNAGREPIEAGARARVLRVEGLVVHLERE